MAIPGEFDNRVRAARQARGWTQEQLAQAAGLSRAGVSAIEAARLVPSVAAALGLAGALDSSVEDLFGRRRSHPAEFAWLPASFPCRYWIAEVCGRTLLYPLEIGLRNDLPHDGVARHVNDLPTQIDIGRTTLVLASCDPAAGYLAASFERQSACRMLVFTRTSSDALGLVERGLVHVGGIHFSSADDRPGNAAEVARRTSGCDVSVVHVAHWEAGLAIQPALRIRTATAAARSNLRWIGRPAGAAARRYQDKLLGGKRPPRQTALDHRGVVEAIRSQWAEVGVCLRLAAEEGNLAFLPLGKENYDLCFQQAVAADPRIVGLLNTIRSTHYRQLLADLPGYWAHPQLGQVQPATAH